MPARLPRFAPLLMLSAALLAGCEAPKKPATA